MSFGKRLGPALRGVVGALGLALVGCQPSVREDRTITFGPDGQATFQHGRNGVFVTDPATGKPKRIYEPGPDDIAFSPPVWDATNRRMVFAVARSLDGAQVQLTPDAPADGRRYPAIPVRYTCWLYDPAGAPPVPEKIFEAACGHAGYVAAGRVVGWHPDGTRLDFVDRSAPNQHQVRAFDLDTRTVESVDLPTAEHLALGSSAGSPRRVALLGGAGGPGGIWLGGEAGGAWWRIPDSAPETVPAQLPVLPRWSRDGTKIAFLTGTTLRVCEVGARRTESWFQVPGQSAALHWHPDGTCVGLVDGSRLGLVGPKGWQKELTPTPVVSFAGWDASGRRMAYVTAEPLPFAPIPPRLNPPAGAGPVAENFGPPFGWLYATLFAANASSRSAIWFADANGANPKLAVSGPRATFPHWSPTEPRLSVWLTVEPPYRLLAEGRPGMRSGDPAAILHADTGRLDWLPVSGAEHAQIGHFELRAGRLPEALMQFDEAAASLPPGGKADWMFFRAVALQKAGREADARDAWQRFEAPKAAAREAARNPRVRLAQPPGVQLPGSIGDGILPRHRFAAEAFVSLDMATEGITFLRREVGDARSARDRLSATIALCQLLLLTDRRAELAECVADDFLPLAGRALAEAGSAREGIDWCIAQTLLPLALSEFAAVLPEGLIRRVSEKGAAWPDHEDNTDFACQLVLRTCGRRLRDQPMIARAGAGLSGHPATSHWTLSAEGEVDHACLLQSRAAFLVSDMINQTFGVDVIFQNGR